METSDSMAWECTLFTHEFLGFHSKKDIEMKLQNNTSYIVVTTSSKSKDISHTNMV